MDASFRTNIIRDRTVFSNILTKQVMINAGTYKSAATLTAGGAGSSATMLNQAMGGVFITPTEFTTINGFTVPPPLPNPVSSGSYYFTNSSTDYGYLSIANSPDFSMGTGDFTIEWFQNLQSPNSFPRIFSLGSYENAITMGVSIEGETFYFWINNQPLFGTEVSVENVWTHFAVVRNNGTLTLFMNGTPIGEPISNNANMVDSINNLVIGNESSPSYDASFSGYLSNFRIIKGSALYTTTFTPPTESLRAITGTVLLLKADNPQNLTQDATGKTVVNTNITWDVATPF